MAQKEDQLGICLICMDPLKGRAEIPCGHSYCMTCIKTVWDSVDQKKIHGCPQCRQAFQASAEQLKKTEVPSVAADHRSSGPEDVACDICTGTKRKALNSCLVCLASYCEKHIRPHYESPTFKRHKLVEPSERLWENICSRHDEAMKMFCRTDQQCICYLCPVDEHKGHNTVSAAVERAERQRELELSRQQIQQRIRDREKDVETLRWEVEAIDRSADEAVRGSEKIFTELIRLIRLVRKRSANIRQQIRSQQEMEVCRVKELQERLRQEIVELRRKDAELKELSDVEDHIQFLRSRPSTSQHGEASDSPSINIRPLRYFEDVTAALSELRDKMKNLLRDTWTNVSLTVTEVDVLLSEADPRTRAEFLQYLCDITLDLNTAYPQLILSEGNRKAERTSQHQSYFTHPDWFTGCGQVLSRESLTGRCYWEVEWSGGRVYVAVAYKNISRTGSSWTECGFGFNDKSWALSCYTNNSNFVHNTISTPVSNPHSSKVGVYLDHRAGLLSFYSVSEAMTLLHRVQTIFTQPLHVGLWLYYPGVTAEFCKLK